jgi:hypothetical protein
MQDADTNEERSDTPKHGGCGNTPELSGHGDTPEVNGCGDTPEPSGHGDTPEVNGCGDTPELVETIDYALIAFQWAEANLITLNNRCNDAIANGMTALLIPACDLPHPDSWPDVCGELTRNGFNEIVIQTDGILVTIPE